MRGKVQRIECNRECIRKEGGTSTENIEENFGCFERTENDPVHEPTSLHFFRVTTNTFFVVVQFYGEQGSIRRIDDGGNCADGFCSYSVTYLAENEEESEEK